MQMGHVASQLQMHNMTCACAVQCATSSTCRLQVHDVLVQALSPARRALAHDVSPVRRALCLQVHDVLVQALLHMPVHRWLAHRPRPPDLGAAFRQAADHLSWLADELGHGQREALSRDQISLVHLQLDALHSLLVGVQRGQLQHLLQRSHLLSR